VNWTGVYVGGNLGGTVGHSNVEIPDYPSKFNISEGSFSLGGQVGANWQATSWLVLGVEGDGDWMNEYGSHSTENTSFPTEKFTTRYDARYSARGRIGLVYGNGMFYATGGWAGTDLARANYVPLAAGVRSANLSGYSLGGGVEWMLAPHYVVGVEYLHDQFSRQNFVYNGPTSVNLENNTVRVRFSYLFGWEAAPPPPAPPPPMAPPPPPPPPVVKTFIVFFDFNKSNLTAEAQSVVGEAVKVAKANGFVRVEVTGHTDTVGSDSYNMGLSVRRAEAVKDEMVREGMDGSGVSIQGQSYHDPLVPTGPGVREPQNRRAVIDLGG
jgi:outer membrane protein OmpA-like peptidoglycan-associated protein